MLSYEFIQYIFTQNKSILSSGSVHHHHHHSHLKKSKKALKIGNTQPHTHTQKMSLQAAVSDQNNTNNFLNSYPLTQQQRLLIISNLLDQAVPKLPLQVDHAPSLIASDNNSSNVSSNVQKQQQPGNQEPPCFYEVLGQRQRKRTQASNLAMKLREYQGQQNAQRLPAEPTNNNNNEEGQDTDESEEQIDVNRYFNSKVRCFRCKKIGHYNTHCPVEFFCLYCLSSRHSIEKCPQRIVCFRCYNYGHINAECRQYEGPYCPHCKRRHKNDCYFLTRGADNFKEIFDNQFVISDPRIKCIICGKTGHLRCTPSTNTGVDKPSNTTVKDTNVQEINNQNQPQQPTNPQLTQEKPNGDMNLQAKELDTSNKLQIQTRPETLPAENDDPKINGFLVNLSAGSEEATVLEATTCITDIAIENKQTQSQQIGRSTPSNNNESQR